MRATACFSRDTPTTSHIWYVGIMGNPSLCPITKTDGGVRDQISVPSPSMGPAGWSCLDRLGERVKGWWPLTLMRSSIRRWCLHASGLLVVIICLPLSRSSYPPPAPRRPDPELQIARVFFKTINILYINIYLVNRLMVEFMVEINILLLIYFPAWRSSAPTRNSKDEFRSWNLRVRVGLWQLLDNNIQ